MATPKPLSDLEWVKLATSTDKARPVLTGVHIDGRLEATDAYRIHVAASVIEGLTPGVYDPKTFAKIEHYSPYPNVNYVITDAEPQFEVEDFEGMWAITAAAMAASKAGRQSFVTLPRQDGEFTHLTPGYLLDVLRGAVLSSGPESVGFVAAGSLNPVKFTIATMNRTAVLMAVRNAMGPHPDPRFDLSEFCRPIVKPEEGESA